jgi:hypothetical protein
MIGAIDNSHEGRDNCVAQLGAKPIEASMIRHTVVFRLRHAPGSAEERDFLDAAQRLARISGVERFERLRQVSAKNEYRFGLSMEFADQAAYSGYNDHPDHVAFVRDRWVTEVQAFLEIDYVALA